LLIARRIFWIIALLFIGIVVWSMISDMLESNDGTVMAFGIITIVGIVFGYAGYHKEIDRMLWGTKSNKNE